MPFADLCRIVFVTAMWGFSLTGVKEVLAGAPTLGSAGARFLLAGLVLMALERRAGVPRARRASPRAALGIGLLQTTGLFGFAYVGLEHSAASAASVVINTTPLLAVVLAVPVLGERPRPLLFGGLLLGLAGVALVSGGGGIGSAGSLALLACGALSWALATVALKRLGHIDPLSLAGRQLVAGSLVLLLAGALLDEPRWDPTFAVVAWFAALVVLGGVATFAVWFGLLERHSVARVSAYMLLTPVFGVAGGVLIRGEPVSAGLVLGTGLVIAGVATAHRQANHPGGPA